MAVSCQYIALEQALALSKPGATAWSDYLSTLAGALQIRFDRTENLANLEGASEKSGLDKPISLCYYHDVHRGGAQRLRRSSPKRLYSRFDSCHPCSKRCLRSLRHLFCVSFNLWNLESLFVRMLFFIWQHFNKF
jgi:hypothetical protein